MLRCIALVIGLGLVGACDGEVLEEGDDLSSEELDEADGEAPPTIALACSVSVAKPRFYYVGPGRIHAFGGVDFDCNRAGGKGVMTACIQRMGFWGGAITNQGCTVELVSPESGGSLDVESMCARGSFYYRTYAKIVKGDDVDVERSDWRWWTCQ